MPHCIVPQFARSFVVFYLTPDSLQAKASKFTPQICLGQSMKKKTLITKNADCSTGPLTRPFARSLAPLTRLLASHYSLRLRTPLRSLVCSLAHFAHFRACGTQMIRWLFILCFFQFWPTVPWWFGLSTDHLPHR